MVGELKRVRGRPAEPVDGGDDEGVAGVQGGDRAVEPGPARPSTRDAVIDVEVVATDADGEQVSLLPVGTLTSRRHLRVAVELPHCGASISASQPTAMAVTVGAGCDTRSRDESARCVRWSRCLVEEFVATDRFQDGGHQQTRHGQA